MHGTTYEMFLKHIGLSEENAPISKSEFPLLANQAWQKLLKSTYGRVGRSDVLEQYKDCISDTICALVVAMNENALDGSDKISHERIDDHTVTFKDGASSEVIESALSTIDYCNGKPTNLRYRGNSCRTSYCYANGGL